jgi:hypothetical protein
MQSPRKLAWAAAIALSAAILAPPLPAHAGSVDYGFNAYTPVLDARDNLARQKALGNIPVRRFFVFWNLVQPDNSNQWQWDNVDRQYKNIVDAGMKPAIALHGSPCWASPKTSCQGDAYNHYAPGLPDPGFLAQWKRFVSAAVKRYPAATAVEIWNEANLSGLNASGAIDPVGYTSLLKASYQTVKPLRPTLPVVSTGVSANLVGQGNWQAFLQVMFSKGAASYMDGLGLHPYPVEAAPGQLTWSATQFAPILDEANRIQSAFKVRKPLWLTEAGCGSTLDNSVWRAITPDQQASDCVSMLKQAAARGDVRAMYVHTLDDATGQDWLGAMGVYGPDGRPKPVACAISKLLLGSLQC